MRAPIVAPAPTVTNGADRHVGADRRVARQRRSDGSTPGAGRSTPAKSETARANAEYGSSAFSTAHGAEGSPVLLLPRITAEARVVFELRQVARVGDKGEIAGLCLLDGGDPHDVELAVTLEAAVQLFRDVA